MWIKAIKNRLNFRIGQGEGSVSVYVRKINSGPNEKQLTELEPDTTQKGWSLKEAEVTVTNQTCVNSTPSRTQDYLFGTGTCCVAHIDLELMIWFSFSRLGYTCEYLYSLQTCLKQ